MYLIVLLCAFIPMGPKILVHEMNKFNNILITQDIPFHICTGRVKTLESAMSKSNRLKLHSIYDLHDIVACKYVFYDKKDLYKFYSHVCKDNTIVSSTNYIITPKINSYKALHFRYLNLDYTDTSLVTLECQLLVIGDYYDSVYGNSSLYKDYNTLKILPI